MAILSNIITPTNVLTATNTQTVTNKTLAAATNNIEARSAPNATSFGFRNRIINGDMRIDQRNAGASVTQSTSNQWPVDRFIIYGSVTSKFSAQQNAGAVTPPAGFTNYLGITSLSAYSIVTADIFVIQHKIEGFNIADFGWGTANAQTVTLSFWVRSSLTGTFGGTLGGGQTYPFTYTITAANTWEQKTITIPGSTSGTWQSGSSMGADVRFGLGVGATYSQAAGSWTGSSAYSATGATSVVGTNGATFYVTGVQLEAGSTATPFERRDYGTELMMCQRYYEKSYPIATVPGASSITGGMSWLLNGYSSSIYVLCTTAFKVTKRTSATIAYWDAAGNSLRTTALTGGGLSQTDNNNNIYATVASESGFFIYILAVPANNYGWQWTASAEL